MIPALVLTAAAAAIPSQSERAETVLCLHVQAREAPRPAMQYQLLPEVRELNPGNAAQWFLRCFAEQNFFFFSKEANADRNNYLTMPLSKLPAQKLRTYGGGALKQADWAARLDTVDWQVLHDVQTEGMDLMLSELGPLQTLSLALRVRLRAQVASRHFDEAVGTIKTLLALARHLGQHPTLAANLTGISIGIVAIAPIEEMLQQPGCPNLYWALANLPSPLVDIRRGVQGERALVAADFELLKNDGPMTEAQLEQVIRRLSEEMSFARQQAGLPPRSLRACLHDLTRDEPRVRAARQRLCEAGCAAKLVCQFSPLQIILLDAQRDYEVQRDEAMKLAGLAPYEIDSLGTCPQPGHGDAGVFADLLPNVIHACRAQARLEQRLRLLRHVEALRLYAAAHQGQLPTRLADVGVPLPVDPFTGKPFLYHLKADTACLCGSPPRGEEHNPEFNVRYEVTLSR